MGPASTKPALALLVVLTLMATRAQAQRLAPLAVLRDTSRASLSEPGPRGATPSIVLTVQKVANCGPRRMAWGLRGLAIGAIGGTITGIVIGYLTYSPDDSVPRDRSQDGLPEAILGTVGFVVGGTLGGLIGMAYAPEGCS